MFGGLRRPCGIQEGEQEHKRWRQDPSKDSGSRE